LNASGASLTCVASTLVATTAALDAATLTLEASRFTTSNLTLDNGEGSAATVVFASGAIGASDGNADATRDAVDGNNGAADAYVDAILTATETATVGAATFTGTGYFASPQGTDASAATFETSVRCVDYCAEVEAFAATATGPTTANVVWSATDETARVCVERENAAAPNGWEVVAITPTKDASPLEVALSEKERFRIFDGQTFVVDAADGGVLAPFWQVASWAVVDAESSGAPDDGDSASRFLVAAAWAVPVDRAV